MLGLNLSSRRVDLRCYVAKEVKGFLSICLLDFLEYLMGIGED